MAIGHTIINVIAPVYYQVNFLLYYSALLQLWGFHILCRCCNITFVVAAPVGSRVLMSPVRAVVL